MGKKKGKKEEKEKEEFLDKLACDMYTYTIGEFKHIPGDPPDPIQGVKGKDNYPHTTKDDVLSERKVYNGHGCYQLFTTPSRLELTIEYQKGILIDSNESDDKGSFSVDIIAFIRRNVLRDGEKIKRISQKLIEELNKLKGCTLQWAVLLHDEKTLPPPCYLSLLDLITKLTPLKSENKDLAVIGVGTCIKKSDEKPNYGKVSIIINDKECVFSAELLKRTRVGDEGKVIYFDDRKDRTGFMFEPYNK